MTQTFLKSVSRAVKLSRCFPRLSLLRPLSPRLGPLKARFTGRVELSEIDPNNSYRIQGEGSGGVAGFAKGGARVHLRGAGDSTVLTYELDAQIGGKMAQLGSRLVTGVVKGMPEKFFTTLVSKIGQGT